jgi:hypothetical protein
VTARAAEMDLGEDGLMTVRLGASFFLSIFHRYLSLPLAPQCHARNYRVLSTYAVDCKSMTGGHRIISVIKSVHAWLMQLGHLNQIRSHVAATIQVSDSRVGRWRSCPVQDMGIPRRGKQSRGPHGHACGGVGHLRQGRQGDQG